MDASVGCRRCVVLELCGLRPLVCPWSLGFLRQDLWRISDLCFCKPFDVLTETASGCVGVALFRADDGTGSRLLANISGVTIG